MASHDPIAAHDDGPTGSTHDPQMAAQDQDPFDDLFNLEDGFYDEGFRQGQADGERAGKIEGRTLGLENGFKKFAESGRLHGKAVIWANRLYPEEGERGPGGGRGGLPPLPHSTRLQKNLRMFYALIEPNTLSTANTDEAVNDFDDRVKRAQGKARVIEKMVGELADATAATAPATATTTATETAATTTTATATAGGASASPSHDMEDAATTTSVATSLEATH